MSRSNVTVSVNGEQSTHEIDTRRLLVDFIREDLSLTGTHIGCEQGVCGACTVRVDGEPVRSCLMLAVQADGASIETVEALADHPVGGLLQEAFSRRHALQCGFCTAGLLVSATSVLASRDDLDQEWHERDVENHVAGHLCRCTGYSAIVDAVNEVDRAPATAPTAEGLEFDDGRSTE